MASYFDEHNCEPLGENERPNNDLLLARLLLDSGIANALGMDFETLIGINHHSSGTGLAPATSKEWLKNAFETRVFDEALVHGTKCPICLKEFVALNQNDHVSKTAIRLPCGHDYHTDCIKLWLEQTSSCPSCRHELPTDDASYEQFKIQRKREQEKKKELESLHDSMYT